MTIVNETGLENVHETGTVVAIEGPRFSSRAESMLYRQWGGDVINMTSVPEVKQNKKISKNAEAIFLFSINCLFIAIIVWF